MISKSDQPNQEELFELIELLYFAYRDFTSDPDAILAQFGFGRAHHRVLYFVNCHPGLRVADLLDILKITKQSLARVLKQLIDEGYIYQQSGKLDRRERHLYTTEKGATLAAKLAETQIKHLGEVMKQFSPRQKSYIYQFLETMIDPGERPAILQLVSKASKPALTEEM